MPVDPGGLPGFPGTSVSTSSLRPYGASEYSMTGPYENPWFIQTPAQVAELLFSQSETTRALTLYEIAHRDYGEAVLIKAELAKLIAQHKATNIEFKDAGKFEAPVNAWFEEQEDAKLVSAREIFSHRVNGLNEQIRILAITFANQLPASCSQYILLIPITGHRELTGPSDHCLIGETPNKSPLLTIWWRSACASISMPGETRDTYDMAQVHFQEGPIRETGVNGVSNEALLAVLIDRLETFQKGQFSCPENAKALTKLEEAGLWLHKRTMNRTVRGVEGTSAP